MPTKRAIKFLALHGHAMNPQAFEKKIGAVRSELKKLGVEFVFAQGPIIPDSNWMNPNAKEEAENHKKDTSSKATTHNADVESRSIEPQQQQDRSSSIVPSAATMKTASNSVVAEGKLNSSAQSTINASVPSTELAVNDEITMTVYSWADFWSWERNKLPKPHYLGFAASVKSLAEVSETHGPFDGIFAFSQGTGVAALLLALEAQELRRAADAAETANSNDRQPATRNAPLEDKSPRIDDKEFIVVDDNTPPSEWRIPKSLHLLRTSSSSDGAPPPPPPFLLVNVSGVVQRDEIFGNFVKSQLLSLPETEKRLAAVAPACSTTAASVVGQIRPLHVLNVFGQNDTVVLPDATRAMTNLYHAVCNETTDEPSSQSKLTFGGTSTEWCHEGGHVVPAALRKPLKALIEQIFLK